MKSDTEEKTNGFLNTRKKGFRCFECNGVAEHAHHVVPASLGGTRTIPLCESCHGKVHNHDFTSIGTLIKEGLKRRKASGQSLGRPIKVNPPQILELRSHGLSMRAIAKLLNISASSVCTVLKVQHE